MIPSVLSILSEEQAAGRKLSRRNDFESNGYPLGASMGKGGGGDTRGSGVLGPSGPNSESQAPPAGWRIAEYNVPEEILS